MPNASGDAFFEMRRKETFLHPLMRQLNHKKIGTDDF